LPAAQQQQPFSLRTFLTVAQPQIQQVESTKPYTDGGKTRWILPQSGAASMLMVNIQGSVTVAGTVTGGTFQGFPYPAPLSIINNVSLFNGQNIQLHNLSGWGWYKWARKRYAIDPFSIPAGHFSSGVNTVLGVGAPSMAPGQAVAAGTYNFNITLPLPIAYNRELLTGLLALGSNSIQYPFEITWGNIVKGISATGGTNDLFNGLTGSGLSITANINTTVDIELIQYPVNYPPNLSMFMTVNESTFGNPVAGVNVVRPAPSDLYTMFMLEAVNNGSPISPATISETVFRYGGNIIRYDQDFSTQLGFGLWETGIQETDGTMAWDLGIRGGLVAKRDLYDAFNDAQVTDLRLEFTIPQTTTIEGVGNLSLITEALRFVAQSS
jgi:hypothetical protein